MAKTEALRSERLKEALNYDESTGVFTWRINRRGTKAGDVAGSLDKNYRNIRVDGVDYQAARLAWFWVKGEWPRLIRFQDRNKDNCAISNLTEGFYLDTKHDHRTKEGRASYQKEYRSTQRDKFAEDELKRKFGIGLQHHQEMLDSQGGVCAICGEPEKAKRHGTVRRMAVDHCHATGKIRGLLCSNCNPMLGYAKDRIDVMAKAIEYLKRHGAT